MASVDDVLASIGAVVDRVDEIVGAIEGETIRKFVGKVGYAYRNANPPFKPLAMEALIRVLLGEEELLDEVSAEDQCNLEIMAIRMIVDQFPEVNVQLDAYLSDAETLAAQWQDEG